MPTENSTQSNNTAGNSTEGIQGTTTGDGAGQQGSGEANTANSQQGSGTAPGQGGSGNAGQGAGAAAGHSPRSEGVPNFGELVTAIQGMPEAVVRAIREATPPAQQSRTRQTNQDTGNQGNGAQTGTQAGSQGSSAGSGTPGRKSFGEWWFGR